MKEGSEERQTAPESESCNQADEQVTEQKVRIDDGGPVGVGVCGLGIQPYALAGGRKHIGRTNGNGTRDQKSQDDLCVDPLLRSVLTAAVLPRQTA